MNAAPSPAEVKRYGHLCYGDGSKPFAHTVIEMSNGEYVLATDYDAILAERNVFDERLSQAQQSRELLIADRDQLRALADLRDAAVTEACARLKALSEERDSLRGECEKQRNELRIIKATLPHIGGMEMSVANLIIRIDAVLALSSSTAGDAK